MKHRFTVIFEKEDEGGYHVFCPALPGCHTQSETQEKGIENIREAMQLYVESLVEDGLPVPEEDILNQAYSHVGVRLAVPSWFGRARCKNKGTASRTPTCELTSVAV